MNWLNLGEIPLSNAALDVLSHLKHKGPLEDGSLPNEMGMSELIQSGLAEKNADNAKPNRLTSKGTQAAAIMCHELDSNIDFQ